MRNPSDFEAPPEFTAAAARSPAGFSVSGKSVPLGVSGSYLSCVRTN